MLSMFRLLLLCIAVLFLLPARAQDLRSDTIDIGAYQLRLNVTDFATKILRGDATIGIKAKMNTVESIRLDLLKLTVDSVNVDGLYNAPFDYNDTLLNINLLTTLNTGDSATVRVYYHGHPLQVSGDFGGFYWDASYAFNIGVSFLADPHTYGRVWFPCFDNFTERSFYEFYVTTKNTHKAFCNGLLLGVTPAAGNTQIWHWKLGQDIPSYLASVAVSNYQTLNDTVNGLQGTVPIQLAARANDTTTLKNLFVHLHDAFHVQETAWGPYKWDRVGYTIVPFNAGAMEHATNIGFMLYYLTLYTSQCETTMAHELSHHWFGDLVTCEDASQMWLNEGWASYNEPLFIEKVYGDSAARQYVRDNHFHVLQDAHVSDGAYLPVGNVPGEQTYGTTVYDKGSDIIHTLRWYLGDATFFSCVKQYLQANQFNTGSNTKLRDYLLQCSGNNAITDYFNDWVLAEGFPHFSIEETFTSGSNNEYTHVIIRQRLHHAPHYYNRVPVKVTFFRNDLASVSGVAEVSGECTEFVSTSLNFTPAYIALDFDEDIQDAITDQSLVVNATGTYDFGTAKAQLTVNQVNSPSLLRVEHNWIAADAMRTPIAGLHLNTQRYWTIGGVWNTDFDATATIAYDNAGLDNGFIASVEDSLVLMYRAKQTDEWAMLDSALFNTGVNHNDGAGTISIPHIKAGEYALAMYKATQATDTNNHISCRLQVGIQETAAQAFTLYPNPANASVQVQFQPNAFESLSVYDVAGKLLSTQKIAAGAANLTISTKNLTPGSYLVTLHAQDKRSSKVLIKQ